MYSLKYTIKVLLSVPFSNVPLTNLITFYSKEFFKNVVHLVSSLS